MGLRSTFLVALRTVIIFTNSHCSRNTADKQTFLLRAIKGLVEFGQRFNLHGKLHLLGSIRMHHSAGFVTNHKAKLEGTAARRCC